MTSRLSRRDYIAICYPVLVLKDTYFPTTSSKVQRERKSEVAFIPLYCVGYQNLMTIKLHVMVVILGIMCT